MYILSGRASQSQVLDSAEPPHLQFNKCCLADGIRRKPAAGKQHVPCRHFPGLKLVLRQIRVPLQLAQSDLDCHLARAEGQKPRFFKGACPSLSGKVDTRQNACELACSRSGSCFQAPRTQLACDTRGQRKLRSRSSALQRRGKRHCKRARLGR